MYTVSQESVYVILTGVPSVGASSELRIKCEQFGDVVELYLLDDYPCEKFTDAFLVKYKLIQSARYVVLYLDNFNIL